MVAEREEFDSWYEANKDIIKFNLNDTIAEYCANGRAVTKLFNKNNNVVIVLKMSKSSFMAWSR